MDVKTLKKDIENLSELNGEAFRVSLQKILLALFERIQKLESNESNFARFLENYFCSNLEGLLIKENIQIAINAKKTRFELRDDNLEVDCFAAGTKDGKPILIIAEVKTSIRDEDIDELFKKIKYKKQKVLKNLREIVKNLNLSEEYYNTDQILLILAANKINKSIKRAGEKNDILVIELDDMPSGGVVYWANRVEW